VRFFEIGTCFAPALPDEQLPRETTRLAAIATGARRPPHWAPPAREWDLWDARGWLETMADLLGADGRVVPAEAIAPGSDIAASLGGGILDPAGAVALTSSAGEILGVAGPVRADAADAPPWSAPWIALEVLLPPDPDLADVRRLSPIPTHPASERDLALVADAGIPAARVAETIRAAAGDVLDELRLFDVYEGDALGAGKRSLAFRLRFQAPDRTLTDAEVDAEVARVLERLGEELDVHQRT
jgi:phenylalanyl-tRNA synthetase beta chain